MINDTIILINLEAKEKNIRHRKWSFWIKKGPDRFHSEKYLQEGLKNKNTLILGKESHRKRR